MRSPWDILKYLFGSATGNARNMTRAGKNNNLWGWIGGGLVGAIFGSFAYPIVGTVIGFFVGGLLGSGFNYALSDKNRGPRQ